MTDIAAMQAQVDGDQALAILRRHAGNDELHIEQKLFYPYFHVVARGRLRWLFGERRVKLDCLVDARTGRTSSADELTLERVPQSKSVRLAVKGDITAAKKSARRYASHALARGFKVLGNFNLDVRDASLVHRPFWVVRSSQWRVLVDAVTGELHPLANQELGESQ